MKGKQILSAKKWNETELTEVEKKFQAKVLKIKNALSNVSHMRTKAKSIVLLSRLLLNYFI